MRPNVLDASALLALLQDEAGAGVVAEALESGAAISAVNVAEVVSKLSDAGAPPEAALAAIEALDEALVIYPLERADLFSIGRLRPVTKQLGLSLADRACLALAERLDASALTADRAWSRLGRKIKIPVVAIR